MVSSSSRKAKKFTEYGAGGKYTSDDGESSPAEKYTTCPNDGGAEGGYTDEHYNGSNVLSAENEKTSRIAPVKNTLIGFGVHVVIFIIGLYSNLYIELNVMMSTTTSIQGFFIILPFSGELTLGSIFGSLYLILPLFIYYFASGKKGLIVFPIVLALILIGLQLGFPVTTPFFS